MSFSEAISAIVSIASDISSQMEKDDTYGIPSPQPLPLKQLAPNKPLRKPLHELTTEEFDAIRQRIGTEINGKYEDGKRTPLQNYRFASWGPLVCSFTAAAFSYVAPSKTLDRFFQALNLPNVFPEICLAISVASVINLMICYSLTDMNSPKERMEKGEIINALKFNEIADANNLNEIFGYALLDKAIEKLRNFSAKPLLYKKYEDLFIHYQKIKGEVSERENEIEGMYLKNGGYLEEKLTEHETYNDEEGKEQTRTILPDTTPSSSMFHVNWGKNNAEKRLTEWIDWRLRELSLITECFNEAVERLNSAYDKQKSELQNE